MLKKIQRWWSCIKSFFFRKKTDTASIEALPTDREVQVALANAVLQDLIVERKNERSWKFLKRAAFAGVFGIGFIYYVAFQLSLNGWRLIPEDPLVGVIRIEGNIMNTSIASAEKVVPALKRAFEAENVKAIILAIDSPGGAPVEAERINYVIESLKAKHKKPVFAVIQNVGASAAYMIALHADKIYAGRYSMVGSIGAVMSSWDVHKALEKLNIYQKVYASGELKSMLNPFVPSSQAAEDKAQDIVNLMGSRFAHELFEKRGQLLQKNVKYDTGEIWDGENAKKIGLIDDLGTIESVSSKYPGTTLYEFGPRNKGGGLFTSSAGNWVSEVVQKGIAESFRNSMTAELR